MMLLDGVAASTLAFLRGAHKGLRSESSFGGAFCYSEGEMLVKRDDFDQYAEEWTDREYRLLFVLEEISGSDNEDRTLAAYLADIIDIMEPEPVSVN